MDKDFFYVTLLDNIALGIFTVNTDWQITYFNREAEKITGFTREEAIGRKCYEIFRTELCYGNCHLKQAMKQGIKMVHVRNRIFNKHNQEIPVDITVSTISDSNGKVIGGIESFIDDSIRDQMEKELYNRYVFHDIIGKNEKIVSILQFLSQISKTDMSVLITGETGTGKDLFARVIHNMSKRHNKPFIKVNCAALPANLIESELFGYKKGAFTDAKGDKTGRFVEADGGTILLDEIGDLPYELQAKLLQVLDEKSFYPLGSSRPKKVDVRIISTTNKDLLKLTGQGLFREDLYYRLNGVAINIPPLRERKNDIPLLVKHFLDRFSKMLGKDIKAVDTGAMKILFDYSYPGNVRELMHILEQSVILCNSDRIKVDDLPINLRKTAYPEKTVLQQSVPDISSHNSEKDLILHALDRYGWKRGMVARALKINRTTLWRKMKRYGMLQK